MNREYERVLRESFKITGVTDGRVIDLMKELEKEKKDRREKAEQLANIKKVNIDLRAKHKNLETKYKNALDTIDELAMLIADKVDPSEWGEATQIVKPYYDASLMRRKWIDDGRNRFMELISKYHQSGIGEYIKEHHRFPKDAENSRWNNSWIDRSPNILKRLLVCIDFLDSDDRTREVPLFTKSTPQAEKYQYCTAFRKLRVPCYLISEGDRLIAMKYEEEYDDIR